MKLKLSILFISLLAILTGCNHQTLIPKDLEQFAKDYFDLFRSGNFDEIKKHSNPELISPETESQLIATAKKFPTGELIEIEMIASNLHSSPEKLQAYISYQYQFSNGWAVTEILLSKMADQIIVERVYVDRITQALDELHAFTFKGKSMLHYIVLFLSVAVPLFIAFALIRCIYTPNVKIKWAWILFILIGFIGFSFNWTTGEITTQFIGLHLLGATVFTASPYSPWILTPSIPVGAILFLILRKRLINQVMHNQN